MAKPIKKKKTGGAQKRAAVPVPANVPVAAPEALVAPPKAVARAEANHLRPYEGSGPADASVLDRLWETVEARRAAGDVHSSHSARLLARGTGKVAQKFGEESVELVIEAVAGNRPATVSESADVLYHLMVLWVDAGVRPEEVWAELRRRQGISGLVEKASRPKALLRVAETTKLP